VAALGATLKHGLPWRHMDGHKIQRQSNGRRRQFPAKMASNTSIPERWATSLGAAVPTSPDARVPQLPPPASVRSPVPWS
jgi:hypothetical protein